VSGRMAATLPLPEDARDVSDAIAEKSLVNADAEMLGAAAVVGGAPVVAGAAVVAEVAAELDDPDAATDEDLDELLQAAKSPPTRTRERPPAQLNLVIRTLLLLL
jgi:hypothetical protein